MNKKFLISDEIKNMRNLRRLGKTLSEIAVIMGRSRSVVHYHVNNIQPKGKYFIVWKAKHYNSIARSEENWRRARKIAEETIHKLSNNLKLIIAAMLYWGEGAKKDFSISNTDPALIKTFVSCLGSLGINKMNLRVTLLLYEDINEKEAINFWANILDIPSHSILGVNILKGKKKGKLKYGMCRVRIPKGGLCLKILQSIQKIVIKKCDDMPL